jgi:hypothetical protein
LLVAASQIRPEVAPPQSPSTRQPHVSVGKQAEPFPAAEQLPSFVPVHSTHDFFVVSQTKDAVQSVSCRHWTQACGIGVVSQTVFGAEQSAPVLHGSGEHVPTPPD